MSLIIKGMDMPSSCYMCWINYTCEHIINPPIKRAEGRSENCPLVEIPTPHGRLIDENDLNEMMKRHRPICGEDGSKDRYSYMEWLGIYHAIKELPTILEAEDEQ